MTAPPDNERRPVGDETPIAQDSPARHHSPIVTPDRAHAETDTRDARGGPELVGAIAERILERLARGGEG